MEAKDILPHHMSLPFMRGGDREQRGWEGGGQTAEMAGGRERVKVESRNSLEIE